MSSKEQFIRKSSQGGYFAFPSDYRQPPHLLPVYSFILTLVSAVLLIFSLHSVIFLSIAFLPLLYASSARKDAGVFWYGFIAGAVCGFFAFLSLGTAVTALSIISGAFIGVWLWLTRKFHHYLAFPDSRTAIAGSAHKRFILPSQKQLIFCIASASLFSGLHFLFSALGLLLPPWKEFALLNEFSGAGGTYFCIIFLSTAASSALEYKRIDAGGKLPVMALVAALALISLLTLAAWVFSEKPQNAELQLSEVQFSDYEPAGGILFVDKVPFQKTFKSFNSPAPAAPDPVNTAGAAGILAYADSYFTETVYNVMRDGAQYLTVSSSFPYMINALQKRCREWGISAAVTDGSDKFIINSSGQIQAFDTENLTVKETFYSRHPHWFRLVISGLSILTVFLFLGHSFKRRAKLFASIAGRTV